MSNEREYWEKIAVLRNRLRCWLRMGYRQEGTFVEGRWGTMLVVPTEGYLEASDGPVPFRDVKFLDLATVLIRGGKAGAPRALRSIEGELLSEIGATKARSEVLDLRWSVYLPVGDEPVRVIRVFGPNA